MVILQKIFSYIVDAAQTLILAASLFLITYIFLVRPYQVSGGSMLPNFEDKEYVLTSVISLRFEKLKKGDVVVFQAPNQENSEFKKDFIKRIIGLPGDTVFIKEETVFVEGKKIDESKYLKTEVKTYGGGFLKEGEPVTVPPGSYLVMGDNRTASSDSREWGFVKDSEIIGKSFFVYLPLENMRLIKNPFD